MHRLGPYLMNKDRWLSQSIARKLVITNSKQLEPKKSARLLQEELWRQKLDFREVHQQSLTEMEELRKFPKFFIRYARKTEAHRGSEHYYMELSGRLQELQNEVNCMNDSKDFQDAESVRSGNSHVSNQPMLFPKHPIPEGMFEAIIRIAAPQRRVAKHLGYTWYIGKRFCKSTCFFFSPLSSRIESMGNNHWGTAPYCYSGEKWKTRTKSRSEMPVWTVSQRFSHLQWRSLFKELWGRPTTTADFGSPFSDKFPTPATFACWKIRFKTEGMYLFTISYGSRCNVSKEVELVDSVDELRSSSSTRGVSMPNFEVLDARIASALNKIIHNSQFKKRISLEEQKAQKEDRFLRGRQIAYLIYDHFRVTGTHDSVESYTDLFTIVLRNDDIQEFDSEWDGILLSMTKIPPDEILKRIVQIKNTSVWKTQDRMELYDLETHQKKLGPDYHRLKTMVKRSIEQEIRNKNLGEQKWKFWEERRG